MDQKPIAARKRLLKRGGARNRKHRQTRVLERKHCLALLTACARSWAAGRPLNRFVTIAWEQSGVAGVDSVKATGEWINELRDWLGARGHVLHWAWVQEWGPKFGAHCHILVSLPPELSPLIAGRFTKWARKVVTANGGTAKAGLIRSEKLAFGDAPLVSPEGYQAALLGKVHYMLKCAPAALERDLGLIRLGPKPWGQTGLVYGKRLAIWQGYRNSRVLPGAMPDGMRWPTAICQPHP